MFALNESRKNLEFDNLYSSLKSKKVDIDNANNGINDILCRFEKESERSLEISELFE